MPSLSLPQSHLRHPLTSILGSAGAVRALRALAADRAPRSAPQLARAVGLTPQGVRRVLETLAREQIVKIHGSGRALLYELNALHPFAGSIADLFQEERLRWEAVLESIRETLDRRGAAVSAAWLYGSVARGEDSPDSDLDIAVLVRAQSVADQLREDLMPLEDRQYLRISLTALTPKELAALPEDDPWWSAVARDSRVLKGPAPDQMRRRLTKAAA